MKLSRKYLFTGVVVSLMALGLAYVLWGGLEQNLVYFVTPTELINKGEKAVGNPVRLGGVVAPGTIHYEANILTFELTDDVGKVPVVTTKTPPQMFQDNMGVVVEGRLTQDGKFNAERLMVKHGNEYRPPKEGEMPREIYQQLKKPNQ